jgi:hypothetical protein
MLMDWEGVKCTFDMKYYVGFCVANKKKRHTSDMLLA